MSHTFKLMLGFKSFRPGTQNRKSDSKRRIDMRKDGSVRVRSSIKWSMPDAEQYGEKN